MTQDDIKNKVIEETISNIKQSLKQDIQLITIINTIDDWRYSVISKHLSNLKEESSLFITRTEEEQQKAQNKLNNNMANINFKLYTELLEMDKSTFNTLKPDYIIIDDIKYMNETIWRNQLTDLLLINPEAKVIGISNNTSLSFEHQYNDHLEYTKENPFAHSNIGYYDITELLVDKVNLTINYISFNEVTKQTIEQIKKRLHQNKYYINLSLQKELNTMLKDENINYQLSKEFLNENINKDKVYSYFISKKSMTNEELIDLTSNLEFKYHLIDIDNYYDLTQVTPDIIISDKLDSQQYHTIIKNITLTKFDNLSIFDFSKNYNYMTKLNEAVQKTARKRITMQKKLSKNLYDYNFKITTVNKETTEQIKKASTIIESNSFIKKFYPAVVDYYKTNKNCNIPFSHITKDGYELGVIVYRLKTNKDKLPEEEKEKLEQLGLFAKQRVNLSQNIISELLTYKSNNGNYEVPFNYINPNTEYPLGDVIYKILHCGLILTSEDKEKLKQIGFVLNEDHLKKQYLRHLVVYYKENNASTIPKNFKTRTGYELGKTTMYYKTHLEEFTDNEKQLLTDIGFLNKPQHRDNVFYDHLVNYYKENGNTNIKKRYICPDGYKLGEKSFEYRNNKSNLSEEYISRLSNLGFSFEKSDPFYDTFLPLLKKYKDEHGNANVPYDFRTDDGATYDERGYSLGKMLRSYIKKIDQLPPEKQEELRILKIKIEKKDPFYHKIYPLLKAYKEYYGNYAMAPNFVTEDGIRKSKTGYKLGKVVYDYQTGRKKIKPNEKKLLTKINFPFEKQDLFKEVFYPLITKYSEENGHCDVPPDFITLDGITPIDVGHNLYGLTYFYKRNIHKLSEEQIEALKLINFNFSTKQEMIPLLTELCNENNINYETHKEVLLRAPLSLTTAKINFLKNDNVVPEENSNLHEIFTMTNYNMKVKYGIDNQAIIERYSNKKEK